ncbi:MAG TPA: cation-translocating P-type ATPase [Egibacteraceae bacterium]|nr:cation-translocating P-type ATPase [Egibacteraceae bacterium]
MRNPITALARTSLNVLTLPLALLPVQRLARAGDAEADAAADATEASQRDWFEEVGAVVGGVVREVGEDVGDFVEDLGDLVEGSFEFVGDVVEEGVNLVEDTLGLHRRVWQDEDADHAQIELRGVSDPGERRLRRAFQQALERLEGVHWAEVNAVTSRVAVAFDGGAGTLEALISAVEGVEAAFGVKRRLDERDEIGSWDYEERAEHPSDIEPIHRSIAAIAGGVASLGWTVAGRAARLARVPVELTGMVSVVDHHPWLRERVEDLIGRRATATILPLAGAVANGVAQGPIGILLDLTHQASLLGELRARRRVWELREPEFYATHSDGPIEPPDLGPRPIPFPKGPVEEWAERISLASLAGFAATFAATRSPRRAADAFLAGMPKAARLGREGFATQLGRTLAARGVVPLDGSSLRRLDRINTIVVDSDVLVTGRAEVGSVAAFPAERAEEARQVAERLLDPAEPEAERSDGPWSLRPFAAVADGGSGVTLPRGAKARARELGQAGATPLALLCDGEAVAMIGAAAELDPGAEIVVEAIRRSGHRFVVAGRKGGVEKRFDADLCIPRGKQMGRAIRKLQAEGAAVLAIARRGKSGLAAAGVGVGLTRPNGRPPWGADLLFGRELVETAIIVEATTIAAQVSLRSAQFALAGSALGGLVALTGPKAAAGSRALAMVNGAAAAALLSGTWEAVKLAHRPRPVVVDPTPWHALEGREVLRALDTSETGLTHQAALQRQRVQRPTGHELGPAEPFLAELANPLNPVLGVGAGLSAAIGSMVDAGMVVGLIGLNALVGGVQRLRADAAVEGLLADAAQSAVALRDGEEVEISEDELVRGDIVRLRTGDVVPADCRILEATGLEVDESSITGESLPVAKHAEACPDAAVPDRRCMLYEDTTIATGEATAVVVATGRHTEIARSIASAGPPPASGVELRLEHLTRRLLPGAAAAAAGVAGIGLLRRWPLRDVVSTGVGLAIASVPEGLPFVASAAQLAAARRLAVRNAVVRNPRTVEALGRIEVLCFDKTGTLTEGIVRFRGVSDGREAMPIERFGAHQRAILAAALAASGTPEQAEEGELDQTDRALLDAAGDLDIDVTEALPGWKRTAELPFEASRGVHIVVGEAGGTRLLVVKGAPEAVLDGCVRWRPGGEVAEFDRVAMAEVSDHVDDLASRGWRVLAVAEREASGRTDVDTERLHGLELVGLVVLADPVRRTAAEAVAGVRASGVRPVMVTGDHPNTAAAIAQELEMEDGSGSPVRVLTGPELEEMDDDALAECADEVTVFARVTPSDKVRIVQALQANGRAVAMTGDGANDAAAIRLADVGVALGEGATPAARDAADIVVTDNRIETVIDAVTEGRALWGSVRDALAVLVGGNLGEIGFTGFASLFSRRSPLSPRQFLLVNLFTDLAPAVAIAIRPPRDRSPERVRHEGPQRSLGEALTRDMTIRGVSTAAGASAAWSAARLTGGPTRAGTVGLVALVGTQLGQTMLAGGMREPLVLATGLGSAAVLAGVVQTPGISHFFGCRPLGPLDWAQALWAAGAASVSSQVAGRILEARARAAAAAPQGEDRDLRSALAGANGAD